MAVVAVGISANGSGGETIGGSVASSSLVSGVLSMSKKEAEGGLVVDVEATD